MFDLVFYKDIKFYSSLKNDTSKLYNDHLNDNHYSVVNNINTDLIHHHLLIYYNTEFLKDIYNYCNQYDDYFNT